MPLRDKLQKLKDLKDELLSPKPKVAPHVTNFIPLELRDKQNPAAPAHELHNFVSIVGDQDGPQADETTGKPLQGAYAIAHGKSADVTRFPLPADPTHPKAVFKSNGTVGVFKGSGNNSALVDFGAGDLWHFKPENVHQLKKPEDRVAPTKDPLKTFYKKRSEHQKPVVIDMSVVVQAQSRLRNTNGKGSKEANVPPHLDPSRGGGMDRVLSSGSRRLHRRGHDRGVSLHGQGYHSSSDRYSNIRIRSDLFHSKRASLNDLTENRKLRQFLSSEGFKNTGAGGPHETWKHPDGRTTYVGRHTTQKKNTVRGALKDIGLLEKALGYSTPETEDQTEVPDILTISGEDFVTSPIPGYDLGSINQKDLAVKSGGSIALRDDFFSSSPEIRAKALDRARQVKAGSVKLRVRDFVSHGQKEEKGRSHKAGIQHRSVAVFGCLSSSTSTRNVWRGSDTRRLSEGSSVYGSGHDLSAIGDSNRQLRYQVDNHGKNESVRIQKHLGSQYRLESLAHESSKSNQSPRSQSRSVLPPRGRTLDAFHSSGTRDLEERRCASDSSRSAQDSACSALGSSPGVDQLRGEASDRQRSESAHGPRMGNASGSIVVACRDRVSKISKLNLEAQLHIEAKIANEKVADVVRAFALLGFYHDPKRNKGDHKRYVNAQGNYLQLDTGKDPVPPGDLRKELKRVPISESDFVYILQHGKLPPVKAPAEEQVVDPILTIDGLDFLEAPVPGFVLDDSLVRDVAEKRADGIHVRSDFFDLDSAARKAALNRIDSAMTKTSKLNPLIEMSVVLKAASRLKTAGSIEPPPAMVKSCMAVVEAAASFFLFRDLLEKKLTEAKQLGPQDLELLDLKLQDAKEEYKQRLGILDGQSMSSVWASLPYDFTGSKYEPAVSEYFKNRSFTLEVFKKPNAAHAGYWAYSTEQMAVCLSTSPLENMSDALDAVDQAETIIKHELVHVVQFALQTAKTTPAAGLPARKGPYDYLKDNTGTHATRDVEFYANLVNEVAHFKRDFEAGELKSLNVNEAVREYVAQSKRFQLIKAQSADRYNKLVTEFYRLVSNDPEIKEMSKTSSVNSVKVLAASRLKIAAKPFPDSFESNPNGTLNGWALDPRIEKLFPAFDISILEGKLHTDVPGKAPGRTIAKVSGSNVTFVVPVFDPAVGAVLQALQQKGKGGYVVEGLGKYSGSVADVVSQLKTYEHDAEVAGPKGFGAPPLTRDTFKYKVLEHLLDQPMYHVTRGSSLASIMKKGLIPSHEAQDSHDSEGWSSGLVLTNLQNAVYFTISSDRAEQIAETFIANDPKGSAVILRVNGSSLDPTKLVLDEDAAFDHNMEAFNYMKFREPQPDAISSALHHIKSFGYAGTIPPALITVEETLDISDFVDEETEPQQLSASVKIQASSRLQPEPEAQPIQASVVIRAADRLEKNAVSTESVRIEDLEDAARYLSESWDIEPPIELSELQLINRGELNPSEIPWLDSSYDYEERLGDALIERMFEQRQIPPVIVIDTNFGEVLADGYGRASYATEHGVSVPFARYKLLRTLQKPQDDNDEGFKHEGAGFLPALGLATALMTAPQQAPSTQSSQGQMQAPTSFKTTPALQQANTRAQQYAKTVQEAATKYDVPAGLIDGILWTESKYDPAAKNPASSAAGMAQMTKATQQELKVSDPYEPAQAINGVAQYLSRLLKKFKSPELAVAAYNQGPGNVLKAKGEVPAKAKSYVEAVLSRANTSPLSSETLASN